MAVRVADGAGSGELILAGCGGFDAGKCVGSRRGGASDPGHTEVGGGVDKKTTFICHSSLILSARR